MEEVTIRFFGLDLQVVNPGLFSIYVLIIVAATILLYRLISKIR